MQIVKCIFYLIESIDIFVLIVVDACFVVIVGIIRVWLINLQFADFTQTIIQLRK